MNCVSGLERFESTFTHVFCSTGEAVVPYANKLGSEVLGYYDALTAAGNICKDRLCNFPLLFADCVKDSFCDNAPEAAKEVARQVTAIHIEVIAETCRQMLPYTVGACVVGVVGSLLIDSCAENSPLTKSVSGLFKGMGVIAALGTALILKASTP